MVAADLEKIIAQAVSKNNKPDAARQIEGFKQLGVTNLRHFIVEQKQVERQNFEPRRADIQRIESRHRVVARRAGFDGRA